MKKLIITSSLFTLILFLTSCYNARIITKADPSNQVIKKEWASSFIYGLVPPPTVKTMNKCSSGVARIETKLSFLNSIARIFTLGIYTPMTITVTCADGGVAMLRKDNGNVIMATETNNIQGKKKAFRKATKKTITTGNTTYINFK